MKRIYGYLSEKLSDRCYLYKFICPKCGVHTWRWDNYVYKNGINVYGECGNDFTPVDAGKIEKTVGGCHDSLSGKFFYVDQIGTPRKGSKLIEVPY